MMLPEVVAFIHVPSKRSLRKIRRRALLTEEQEDSILKFRIQLLTTTSTMTVKARDRVASRNTSTKRDAKTKIANPKTTARASWCANTVETAIIGSAKAI
jgi:hypothetical protein